MFSATSLHKSVTLMLISFVYYEKLFCVSDAVSASLSLALYGTIRFYYFAD